MRRNAYCDDVYTLRQKCYKVSETDRHEFEERRFVSSCLVNQRLHGERERPFIQA